MTSPHLISVQNLTVRYGQTVALDDVSFAVRPGEYVGLIGPNGAGKSSLLKVLAGLVKSSAGVVQMPPKSAIGYVPQSFLGQSAVAISVGEVLGMGLSWHGWWPRKQGSAAEAGTRWLAQVGLGGLELGTDFNTLSGGQQQRVVIARSLVHEPRLLLFDEPLSGVDYQTKLTIYDLLAELNAQLGLTILFVSHEVEHITRKCQRILCLNRHLHEGCHPMDFAQGKVRPYDTEADDNLTFVHHHHHHEDGQVC